MSRTTHHRWVECSSVLLHPVVLEHAQKFFMTSSKIGFRPPVRDWMENF